MYVEINAKMVGHILWGRTTIIKF